MKVVSVVHALDPVCVPGQILDLDDEKAAKWLNDNWAVKYQEPVIVETTMMAGAPEIAEQPVRRGRPPKAEG